MATVRGRAWPFASSVVGQAFARVMRMTARVAALRTRSAGSSRSGATSARRSPTTCLAITFAAISRTRHASSRSAARTAGCAVSCHAHSSPRAAHTREPVALFWFPRRVQGPHCGVPTQQLDQAHIGIITLEQAHTPGDERRPTPPGALRFHPLPRCRTHHHPASMRPTTDDRAPHIRYSSA